MKDRLFYIVDVFAESRFSGNQLAVFRNGSQYSDAQMQQIAKEMNYSETTFIISDEPRENGYDVRIFTPAEEVPFAGHPTLGTAYVIMREIIQTPVEQVVLNLTVGRIPVTFHYHAKSADPEFLWMLQKPPHFGHIYQTAEMAGCLGLEPEDVDTRFPVQEVSTGLPFIMVPLKSLEAVKRAKVNRKQFFDLIQAHEAKAPLIFCPETYRKENDLNARVFVDYYDVPEDPATGSANGCLAGYLIRYGYFESDRINVRVEQGYEIGRPSLILLKAEKMEEEIQVLVGGELFLLQKDDCTFYELSDG